MAALAAAAVPSIRAQESGEAREEFTLLGWNNEGCAAAYKILRFARRGLGMEGIPVWARIGSVSLARNGSKPKERWTLQYDGSYSWSADEADIAAETLARAGFRRPGFPETVRPEATAPKPGLDETLRSTTTFEPAGVPLVPPEGFRLSKVFYSWLDDCALLVYEREAAEDATRVFLIRTRFAVRQSRARAHVTNGLLLYRKGDLEGGAAELAVAARMDPDLAAARYYNATLLAAQGRLEDALPELKAAVGLDRRFAEKARGAIELEDLRADPRFKEALK